MFFFFNKYFCNLYNFYDEYDFSVYNLMVFIRFSFIILCDIMSNKAVQLKIKNTMQMGHKYLLLYKC